MQHISVLDISWIFPRTSEEEKYLNSAMISTKIRENIISAHKYKQAKSIYSYLNCLHKLFNPFCSFQTLRSWENYTYPFFTSFLLSLLPIKKEKAGSSCRKLSHQISLQWECISASHIMKSFHLVNSTTTGWKVEIALGLVLDIPGQIYF